MRFPLTDQLIEEAARYELRSACRDCFFYVPDQARCAHEWPDVGQGRWPLDAPEPDGSRPGEAEFCKEFELR
ncbi:hypothetical protein [Haliangium sp.]|uniref:hypothetical protein n=1 Tax=Haliangium sp. TaxID=2663208 RepID=UPI003D11E193